MSIAEKLTTIAENEIKVHEAGKTAEWNAFWDVFQSNGSLTSYNYAFSYGRFNDETFRPKYDIRPTSAERMFAYNNNSGIGTTSAYCITDLSTCLEKAGVVLDTSRCENMNTVFYMGRGFRRIPTISFESCEHTIGGVFYGCYFLETIDKLILKAENTFSMDSWDLPFGQCANLRNITIEGVIGNDITFQGCPLTKASITSIINALSPTVSGKTVTFSNWTINEAMTTAEWDALKSTKPNWTFNLI